MNRFLVAMVSPVALTVFLSNLGLAAASDVDMKVVQHPDHISKLSEFYVRVKITNNGKSPLRGCDQSDERCVAIGWDFVDSPAEITVPGKNIVSLPPYFDSYLIPGHSIEKSIRIRTTAPLVGSNAILSLSLVLKEGPTINLTERRLKLPIQLPSSHVLNRRILVRTMVYGYLVLSGIMLAFFLLRQRTQT